MSLKFLKEKKIKNFGLKKDIQIVVQTDTINKFCQKVKLAFMDDYIFV